MSERKKNVVKVYTINPVYPTLCTRTPILLHASRCPSTDCYFGQLVWYRLKSGKRTLEPNMAPGLFMGWRIDLGAILKGAKSYGLPKFQDQWKCYCMTYPNLSCLSKKAILFSPSWPLPIEPREQAMARFVNMPSEMFRSFLKDSCPVNTVRL